MTATPLALRDPLSILENSQLFDEEWLFQPVPWHQRWLAILVVGLFLVACVPLCGILLLSMALQPIMPASPDWRNVQATVLVGVCLVAEAAWFGALLWWMGGWIL